jgi:phage repressor protein C with HTH and peptisase S24 domain
VLEKSSTLSHAGIWSAIDSLAERLHMSPSALARRAGLDSTTFNRSKRFAPDGRGRWPSTESIAKVLEATGTHLDEFMGLIVTATPALRATLPLIGFAQAGEGGFFDDGGFPEGEGWDEIELPELRDPAKPAYALEVSGDSMLPVYRDGDIVIVSPTAPARRGDRVVVRTVEGEVLAKELKRRTARTIELKSLNPDHPDRVLQAHQISWIARILWSSQ